MNIGILTYHCPYNFGANLQAYATTKFLQQKGFTVKVLNYDRIDTQKRYQKYVPEQQWNGHDNFITNCLPLTRDVKEKSELVEIVKEEKIDGIIVGADAVFSFFPYDRDDIPVFFMDWLFNCPEIANIPVVSMSVANMTGGFKNVPLQRREQLQNYLSKFSFLTVRDKWTRKTINKYVLEDKTIDIINPDPVFYLSEVMDEKLDLKNIVPKNTKFILLSLPKDAWDQYRKWLVKFKTIANKKGYLIGELPLPDGCSGLDFDFKIPYPIDPVQWFLWLNEADGFIGLRFHAVVSCISVATPFFSIDYYGNNSIPVKIFNKLGFYKIGRLWDHKSKIYQLLKGTPFKNNRANKNGFLGLAPQKALSILQNTDKNELDILRKKFSSDYSNNMSDLIQALKLN